MIFRNISATLAVAPEYTALSYLQMSWPNLRIGWAQKGTGSVTASMKDNSINQIGHFYLAKNRTFLFCLDSREQFLAFSRFLIILTGLRSRVGFGGGDSVAFRAAEFFDKIDRHDLGG